MTGKRIARKVALAASVILAVLIVYYFIPQGGKVRETRLRLRTQGFRTDLGDFNFQVSREVAARGRAILAADISIGRTLLADVKVPVVMAASDFIGIKSNAALVAWKQKAFDLGKHVGVAGADPWPAAREMIETNRARLDDAREALLAGPYGFGFNVQPDGSGAVGRHIEILPGVAAALGARVLVELHDGSNARAWSNLLAQTRLINAWQFEPTIYAQKARFRMVRIAFVTIWEAMQAGAWNEEQLVALEKEWKEAIFLDRLPDAVACEGASLVASLEEFRQSPMQSDLSLRDAFKEPKELPQFLRGRSQEISYHSRGVYEDEEDLMIYFRDREAELKTVAQARTVAEMRLMKGATNMPRFISKHAASVPARLIDYDQYSIGVALGGVGLAGFAADAEIRRRLVLTAIALERHRIGKSEYPEKLEEAALEAAAPWAFVDFADGQPLRYHRTGDGHFLLYSIGLDLKDDHGIATNSTMRSVFLPAKGGTDISWPLPAR